jgi:uncharacterized SAM-binding protein YcdF (DUF218 family)
MADKTLSTEGVSDIIRVAEFLAHAQVSSLLDCPSVDVLVLCGNAILPIAENVFAALEARKDLADTLVICGGIGHSTHHLYDAVRRKDKYASLSKNIDGLPEAQVLELILRGHYPELMKSIDAGNLRLIMEHQSTNCGANAVETKRVLEASRVPIPRTCLIVQDPTMSLRTLAAFQHTYAGVTPQPVFFTCPVFVPRVTVNESGRMRVEAISSPLRKDIDSADLWNENRFVDLLMGEIPRLRDDANGYGPRGKNFIVHMDIPREVEEAWTRLHNVLSYQR